MPDNLYPDFSVVVPNWNGTHFLRRGLGSLYLSARAANRPFEIVVVDDASDDASVSLIKEEFPSVRLLVNSENSGFGKTANRGVQESRGSLIVLCNNDLIVREEFIPRLLEPMGDLSVFAVSAKTIDWGDGAPNHIEMHAAWRNGLIAQDFSDPADLCETSYFQGGACVFRRDAFLQFGGFCDLFSPGYWEDYDVAYLAAKAGLRILYNPHAVANHLGKGSMTAKHGLDRLAIIQARNHILFTWLNLSDAQLWLKHCIEFPIAIVRDMALTENSPLIKGFLHAVPKIPAVFAQRRMRRSFLLRRDREILQ